MCEKKNSLKKATTKTAQTRPRTQPREFMGAFSVCLAPRLIFREASLEVTSTTLSLSRAQLWPSHRNYGNPSPRNKRPVWTNLEEGRSPTTHTHTHAHTGTHAHTHAHTHTHAQTYTHVHTHTYTHARLDCLQSITNPAAGLQKTVKITQLNDPTASTQRLG